MGSALDGQDPRLGAGSPRDLANEWFGAFQADTPASQRDILRGPGGFEQQLRALLAERPTDLFDTALAGRHANESERVLAISRAAVEAGLSDPFPSIGRWRNFFGDVEQIVRLTVRSAIELALGIGPHDPIESPGNPVLPIEVFWTRPHPWFEGWVLGRDHRATNEARTGPCGSVTIVFATPPTGTAIIPDPASNFGSPRPTDLSDAGDREVLALPEREVTALTRPTDTASASAPSADIHLRPPEPDRPLLAPRAMLRICHQDHVVLPPINSRRECASGEWIVPEPGGAYVGVGPIRAVHRPTIAGGLNPYAPSAATGP